VQRYLTDPNLKDRFHVNFGDGVAYITMNLLAPPFDDIHVRKAANYAINKAGLLRLWGGPTSGATATHVFPPTLVDFGSDSNYDPYVSGSQRGDLGAAMSEMKQSKYDHNGDGICDDDVCKGVIMISRTEAPHPSIGATVVQDLAQIGIRIKLRELDGGAAYSAIDGVKNLIPIASFPSWAKDYPDPYTIAVLFQSNGINCDAQINYSEVGMTQSQATQCGVLKEWRAIGGNTLSVDSRINQCEALVNEDRTSCWVALDKYLMEDVVPWVPRLWGDSDLVMGATVTKFEFDQAGSTLSLCHIAVNNGISPSTLR
jgi:ABC-type transport system substrate-binding protein